MYDPIEQYSPWLDRMRYVKLASESSQLTYFKWRIIGTMMEEDSMYPTVLASESSHSPLKYVDLVSC